MARQLSFINTLFVLIYLCILGCSTTAQILTAEHKPLAYLGSIQLGTPTNTGKTTSVPISFSGGEWSRNSAIVPYRVKSYTLPNRIIEIAVTTAVAGDGNARPPSIQLENIKVGSYVVRYRDPDGARHEIGSITLK